jgi:hypothetical protein
MNSNVFLVKQNSTAWPGSLFLPLPRVVRELPVSVSFQLMGAVVTKPGVNVRVTVCWRRRGGDSDEFSSYRGHRTG